MSGNGSDLHALLIGIDHYPTAPLAGCVNDVEAIATWLVERAKVAPERITRLVSSARRASPTHAELRTALQKLANIDGGARVFIYYSGHGAQEVRTDETRIAREALVPIDAWPTDGSQERRLLWDYDLNALLSAIGTNRHLTCVLDCCHSSGATRSPPFDEPAILRESTPRSAAVPGTDPPSSEARRRVSGAWAEVVACEASELAREGGVGDKGMRNGLFTRALLEALYAIPVERAHTVLWSEIWYSILERLGTWNPAQHPRQLGAWARPVLGGPPADGDLGFRIVKGTATPYMIHAGTYAGIDVGSELAVYGHAPPVFPPIGCAKDLAARKGVVRVTTARGATSDAVAISGEPFELPARTRVIVESPARRIVVRFDGDDHPIAAAIDSASDRMRPATAEEPYDVWCKRSNGRVVFGDACYTSVEPDHERTLVAPTIDDSEIVTVLEHLRQYSEPVRMARRCRDIRNALVIEVLDCTDIAHLSERDLQDPPLQPVSTRDGLPEILDDHAFCVRITNASRHKLEAVGLVCCTSDGEVQFWGEQLIPALGRATFWARGENGEPFVAGLPDGRVRVVERLVAIGTTVAGVSFADLSVSRSLCTVIDEQRAARGANNFESKAPPKPPERWTGVIQELRFAR